MLRPGKNWYVTPLLTAAAFVGGPLLVHLGILAPIQGFMVFAVSGLFGVISLLWGLRLFVAHERKQAAIAVAMGLVPLAVIGSGMANGAKIPRINDVSTDLDNPPHLTAALEAPENKGLDLAYPETFKGDVRSGYPDLISKPLSMNTNDAFAKVTAAAAGSMPGWKIVRTDPAALTVEGTETSQLFMFVDDFVVRVEPLGSGDAESTKSLVAMRSRSRVGKGDFGVNAARIRKFFAALDSGK